MSAMLRPADENAKDTEVTAEDQQKINRFARLNQRLSELKDDLNKKKNSLQNIDDASNEIILMDDEEGIYLKMGESFIRFTGDGAQEKMDEMKETLEKESIILTDKQDVIKKEMNKLKVELYAKFGSSINLEPEEEE